jgi:hypothetical protein
MDKSNILKLLKGAEVIPKLEYDDDIFKFRDNVRRTIKAVKQRLGNLQSLEAEIEYEITLNHLDDEES